MGLFESSQNSSNPRLDIISDYTNNVSIWELSRCKAIPMDCHFIDMPITIKSSSSSVVPFYEYCHKKPKLK